MKDVQLVLSAIMFTAIGVHLLHHAWIVLKRKQPVVPLVGEASLWVLSWVQGTEVAARRRRAMMTPETLALYGVSAAVCGAGSLFMALLACVALAL